MAGRHALPARDARARIPLLPLGRVGGRAGTGRRGADRRAVGDERLRARAARAHPERHLARHADGSGGPARGLACGARSRARHARRRRGGALRRAAVDAGACRPHGRGDGARDRPGRGAARGRHCRAYPGRAGRGPGGRLLPHRAWRRAGRGARRRHRLGRGGRGAAGDGDAGGCRAADAPIPRRGAVPLGHVRVRPGPRTGGPGRRGAAVSHRRSRHRPQARARGAVRCAARGARPRGGAGWRLRHQRLDAQPRQLLPLDRDDQVDDVRDPAAGGRGRGLQHRRGAGDGGQGEACGHRHPAHLWCHAARHPRGVHDSGGADRAGRHARRRGTRPAAGRTPGGPGARTGALARHAIPRRACLPDERPARARRDRGRAADLRRGLCTVRAGDAVSCLAGGADAAGGRAEA